LRRAAGAPGPREQRLDQDAGGAAAQHQADHADRENEEARNTAEERPRPARLLTFPSLPTPIRCGILGPLRALCGRGSMPMQTVLLADDERVFKAIEGTCLRRDVCRLIKAAPARLSESAASERPHLIIVAVENDVERRDVHRLGRSKSLLRTPIIALDL